MVQGKLANYNNAKGNWWLTIDDATVSPAPRSGKGLPQLPTQIAQLCVCGPAQPHKRRKDKE